ncbi:MAG TPA: septum formation inhibitor [Bacteroidales bacterium]|nr:septum formation inhibitor [Bacteroidales bacterium]
MRKILKIFINKYTITLVLFVVWMVFFDSSSVLNRMKYREKLNSLKQEKHFFLEEIKKDSILSQKLLSDSTEIEKFARENYLMKKEKEDVFLVIDTTADRHQ